jgi:bidirectional [NiFe] hydrogenase diaphorase subunit
MPPTLVKVAPPTDDKRWRVVEAAMRRQGFEPRALIETLHAAQQSFGYLDEPAMRYVAASLHVPPSRVYGVATFYHYFTLKPHGRHTCVVCLGTACYIKGSAANLKAVEDAYAVDAGETTADGALSVVIARCVGACGLAPVAIVDGQLIGTLGPAELLGRVGDVVRHDA